VQQGEYPDEGFMRVNVDVGGPAAKQFALLIEGEGPRNALDPLADKSLLGSMSTRRWFRAKRKY
jgi:hypothetical protein